MENETKPTWNESSEVRYDASGKKITTSGRAKETESAIIAINDKLDQLVGILSSTLPARIGTELRGVASGGEQFERLLEIVSNQLPERIKNDASQNTFEKAEMLSVVISTSLQHLQDTFKSYQDSILKALQDLAQAQRTTSEALAKINDLLSEMHEVVTEQKKPKEPLVTVPPEKESAPKERAPIVTPPPPKESKEERSDLPGWLQAKREEQGPAPEEPESMG